MLVSSSRLKLEDVKQSLAVDFDFQHKFLVTRLIVNCLKIKCQGVVGFIFFVPFYYFKYSSNSTCGQSVKEIVQPVSINSSQGVDIFLWRACAYDVGKMAQCDAFSNSML